MRIVRYYPRALVGDGGMTSAVKRWSHGMVDNGAEAIIAYDEGVEPPGDSAVEWVAVRHAGRKGFKVPIGLESILGGSDVLVLHSAWTFRNIRAAAVARKLGVPYVLEPRGGYDPHIVRRKAGVKKLWWRAWEGELVARAAAIHVFFEPERAHLEALGYRGPVIVVSNGVDVPAPPLWDGGSGGYLLWLGRFDPEHKGLDVLLDGLGSLPSNERPRLRLDGPDWRARKALVRRWVRDRGLGDWVTVGEAVYGADKRVLLAACRGFVYPSRWDACPNSVLESVSLGIPTLTGPFPLGHHLAERAAAFAAEITPEALAAGLLRLSSAEAPEVGAIGAEIVRTELTWPQVAKSWLDQVADIV